MLDTIDILFSFQLAAVARVLTVVFMEENKPLSKYYDLLMRIECKGYKYISDPFGGCSVCFGGQLSLWVYGLYLNDWSDILQGFIKLVLFIMLTIFFIDLFSKLSK